MEICHLPRPPPEHNEENNPMVNFCTVSEDIANIKENVKDARAALRNEIVTYREILLRHMNSLKIDRIPITPEHCLRRRLCTSVRAITPDVIKRAWGESCDVVNIPEEIHDYSDYKTKFVDTFLSTVRRLITQYREYVDIIDTGSKADRDVCRTETKEKKVSNEDEVVREGHLIHMSKECRDVAKNLIVAKQKLDKLNAEVREKCGELERRKIALEVEIMKSLEASEGGSKRVQFTPPPPPTGSVPGSSTSRDVFLRKKVTTSQGRLKLGILQPIAESVIGNAFINRPDGNMPVDDVFDALNSAINAFKQREAKHSNCVKIELASKKRNKE